MSEVLSLSNVHGAHSVSTMSKTKTGILVSSSFGKIVGLLPFIQQDIIKTLYISLYPGEDKLKNSSNTFHTPQISSNVIRTYAKTVLLRNIDVRILLNKFQTTCPIEIITKKPIDIIYFDQVIREDIIKKCIINKSLEYQTVFLDSSQIDETSFENSTSVSCTFTGKPNFVYNHSVLGGTFDRLHAGHKILLSEAVLRSSKKVTVGVTDTPMLYSKKMWELIEPCDVRINNVREFLQDIEPNLEYDIVPISDMYGPTKDHPTFENLIVSAETVGGGEKINELREQNGLEKLDVVSVPLLPADDKVDEQEEDKVSSSNLRMRELGRLMKPVKSKPWLNSHPYIIGLTGGIAAGKSNIAKYLENLGAGLINCDLIGHQIYNVGTPGHQKVRELFGEHIVSLDGTIDRKKLGAIVFGNSDEMDKLNKALWPLILDQVKKDIEKMKESYKVIVIEAAVLLKARWQDQVHEIWVTIIPPKEALQRLKSRNNLSEKEADLRIKALPPNTEYVSEANVVLSSAWDFDYTRKQTERAYAELLQRLPIQSSSSNKQGKL